MNDFTDFSFDIPGTITIIISIIHDGILKEKEEKEEGRREKRQ